MSLAERANTDPALENLEFKNVLVLPAWSEYKRADIFQNAIDSYQNLDGIIPGLEVVVFADGCERSAEIAQNMGATVMRHLDGQNHGRGQSLREAFRRLSALQHERGKENTIYGYADADGPYVPEHIARLFEDIDNGNQLAVSHRMKDTGTPLLRRIAHPAVYQVCERIAPTGIRDPQAGAKAFSQGFVDEVVVDTITDRWAFDREIAAIAHRDSRPTSDRGTSITVLDDFSTVKPVRDTIQMLRDSALIRRVHLSKK